MIAPPVAGLAPSRAPVIEGGSDGPLVVHITTVAMTMRFLRGHIRHLRRGGFRVLLMAAEEEELAAFGRDEDVDVLAISMARAITPLADVLAVVKMWRAFHRLRPAIVHAHTPKAGLVAMAAATLARVPVRIYHVHGLPMLEARGVRRWLLWMAEAVSCHLAHLVLCVSRSMQTEAVLRRTCPGDRCLVVGAGSIAGVDAENRFNPARHDCGTRAATRARLGIPDAALVLGFVGRLVRDKGVRELADAWLALRREFPDLHLLLVGPFEEHDPLSPRTRNQLLSDERVHLCGLDWNTPPLYAIMNVFVLPSYREGLNVSLLEAAAMALPVVTTDVPGCRECVLDGATGRLVPPRSVAQLRDAVAAYLRDPARRRGHGAAGREWVSRSFQPEPIWEGTTQLYEWLLDERSPGARSRSPLLPREQ